MKIDQRFASMLSAVLIFGPSSGAIAYQAKMDEFTSSILPLMRQQKWAEVEQHARVKLSIDPKNANAWEVLGVSLGSQDKLAESVEAFEKAFDIEPEKHSICFNLAISYVKSHQKSKLQKLIQKLKERRRDDIGFQVLDREDVFQALSPDGIDPLCASRETKMQIPSIDKFPDGPRTQMVFGEYRSATAHNGGIGLFEVYVAPDGGIQSFKFLAGDLQNPSRVGPILEEIQFPKLEPSEKQAVQRTKIVLRLAVREPISASGERGLVPRFGIGDSLIDAEKNTVDIKWE